MSPLHSRGSPNKGGQNQQSKPPLGVTMMPLGAPIYLKVWVSSTARRPNSCTARALRAALRLRRPLSSSAVRARCNYLGVWPY